MIASDDGGATFREVGKGFIGGWVFGSGTAVVSRELAGGGAELQRTVDGGRTFARCADFSVAGSMSFRPLPKWYDGKLYWATREGVIASADEGATWERVASIEGALYGPVFGAREGRFFLLTERGVVETRDGGATFSEPVAPPEGFGSVEGLTWLEFAPGRDALYLMKMAGELYRMELGD